MITCRSEATCLAVIPRNTDFVYRFSKIGTMRERFIEESGVSFGQRQRQRKRGGVGWNMTNKQERLRTERGKSGAKKLLVTLRVPEH